MRLNLDRLNGFDTSKMTPKQLCVALDCRMSTLLMFLKRHNIPHKKREYKKFNEYQKKQILETVSYDMEICKVASKLGLERYMVQNFIKFHKLPYKGKKIEEKKLEFFDWADYPNGIY
ncbi:MAG TPA: hypothetical protein VFV31_13000 [Chitinophagaceae bacterium]|nr:hypothetical protein [Chitinophagaceae bacterium]